MFLSIIMPCLEYGSIAYPWNASVKRALNGSFQRLARTAYQAPVDWTSFSHKPYEELMPRTPYFTTMLTRLHLMQIGSWIKQHYDDIRDHPVVEILEFDLRDEKRCSSAAGPKEALLAKARFTEYDELVKAACDATRWATVVRKACLAEEVEAATIVCERRAAEPRTPRWLPCDSKQLVMRRAEVVNKWLDSKIVPPPRRT